MHAPPDDTLARLVTRAENGDRGAREALFSALREGLGDNVELHELDLDVNDPAFADATANRLHELISDQS